MQRAFDQFGRDAKLSKMSGSWYGHYDEVIAVINLQKSNYGPKYYINVGLWLRQLGDERHPKEWKCHVRTRLGELVPGESERLEQLLDLDVEMPDEQRVEELRALLVDRLAPIVAQGDSITGLRAMFSGGARGWLVSGGAQQVLGGDA